MTARRGGALSPGGAPAARGPRVPPALMRLGVRQIGRRVLDPSLPWEVQRRRLEAVMGASPPPPGTNVAPAAMNGVRTDVVTARGVRPARTVVHFHGGGYCVGSARTPRAWAARLSARAACRVVLPDYRLAPEHPHPAALEDAHAVVSAVLAGAAGAPVVVSGDSAGAGLALSLLLRMRDDGAGLPAGCMLLSPWLDLTRDLRADAGLARRDVLLSPPWLEACATAYAPGPGRAGPAVSPLLATHAGLPPLLIQSGTDDLLSPDAGDMATRASAAGVDVTYTRWPGMWHNFALQPGALAAADSALAQAAWFVARVTAPPVAAGRP